MKKIKANPLISDDSVQAIFGIAKAYQQSKVLLTALELDLFTALADTEKTCEELASDIDAKPEALEKLLNALCALNLMEKNISTYQNTKGTARFLVRGKDEYLGSLNHIANLWDTWGNLTEVVKTGKSAKFKSLDEKDADWIKDYVDSLHSQSGIKAPDVISLIDLKGVKRVLDIGCGSAIYSVAFVKAKPDVKAVAFDHPNIIRETQKYIEYENLNSRIEAIGGDVLSDDFGEGFDLVFISDMISQYSLFENIDIFRRAHAALNPSGRLIVQDYIINDDKLGPFKAVMENINMLVNTPKGSIFTSTDLWIMMKEAGFPDVKRIDTPFATDLMVATKDDGDILKQFYGYE
jgi:2-polyprenyl-3-methyl-5-hydroxy-6-metoxy-1,4-benzoquinol methylase